MICQIHSSDAHRSTSGRSYILLAETNTLSIFCSKKNIPVIIRIFYFYQFIIFPKCNGCKPCLSYIGIFFQRRFLYKSFSGCHKQIFSIPVFINRNNCCNFFLRHNLKKIDDRCSSGCPSGLRNLISFQSVYTSCICKEHNVVMCICHEQFFYIIRINCLHSFDSFSAPVLSFKGIF